MPDSIHDFARIIDTTSEPTGTDLVDDFEDGDTTPLSTYWDGWGSSLGVTSSNALDGSYSGEINGDAGSSATRVAPAQVSEYSYLAEITGQTGENYDSATSRLSGPNGNRSVQFSFRYSGGISVGAENDSNTTNGTWSANTVYHVRAYNIDYSADDFDFEITRVSDNVVIRNGTADFRESQTHVDSISHFNDLSAGGGTDYRFDNVQVIY